MTFPVMLVAQHSNVEIFLFLAAPLITDVVGMKPESLTTDLTERESFIDVISHQTPLG